MPDSELMLYVFIFSAALLAFWLTVGYAVYRAANEIREYYERENRKHDRGR